MRRIQIHLTEEQIEGLRRIANGVSRAELIRRAIDELIDNHAGDKPRNTSRILEALIG